MLVRALQPTPRELRIRAEQYEALIPLCRGPKLAAAWAHKAKALREKAAGIERLNLQRTTA